MTTEETIMIANKDNPFRDANSYFIIAADEAEKEACERVVQIVDEGGESVASTLDRFVEIFDQEGLAGFIL